MTDHKSPEPDQLPDNHLFESKKKYTKLTKPVQIVITDFPYLPFDEFQSRFHIIEKNQLYTYTDHLERHVLELPKMNKQVKENPDSLEKWLLFLKGDRKTKGELAMQEPTFQKAYDELNQMSNDKEMRARALSRDIFLKDQMQYQDDAREEGRIQSQMESVKLLFKKEKSPLEILELLEIPLSTVHDYLSL
ncbi:Rpn family recombination-promoting nuclease/putative transposase [Sporosarcina sp. E16_8]|uniref:Rpn family recombination-promoting nuclease/putative transposase n=1 Tax=Sporosarcina sp. E16_8 TaxID=2789295 RepID=UPI001A9293AB|nr:Rpn family recombination-promoting nuclease/putative transposase [Sporosarcina sp. E16_8]